MDAIEAAGPMAAVAKRIINAFADPFTVENHDVFVTASIGISIFPLDSDDATYAPLHHLRRLHLRHLPYLLHFRELDQ